MSDIRTEVTASPAEPPRRRRPGLALATGAGLLAIAGVFAAPVALADPGGNAGDVWVDNAANPPGPGHENDPHLDCTAINVWGSGLVAPGGTITVTGMDPTGGGDPAYLGTWTNTGGTAQPIATIDPEQLVAALPAGTTANPQQGYHFQVVVSQDPQKSKTFWVSGCTSQPGSGSTGGGGGGFI